MEQATFNHNCKDFDRDELAAKKEDQADALKLKVKNEEATAGLSALGIKNGITGGILIIVSFFAYCIISIFLFGGILFVFIPLILLILGIVTLIKGIRTKNKARRYTETLDEGLLND